MCLGSSQRVKYSISYINQTLLNSCMLRCYIHVSRDLQHAEKLSYFQIQHNVQHTGMRHYQMFLWQVLYCIHNFTDIYWWGPTDNKSIILTNRPHAIEKNDEKYLRRQMRFLTRLQLIQRICQTYIILNPHKAVIIISYENNFST